MVKLVNEDTGFEGSVSDLTVEGADVLMACGYDDHVFGHFRLTADDEGEVSAEAIDPSKISKLDQVMQVATPTLSIDDEGIVNDDEEEEDIEDDEDEDDEDED